MSEFTDHHKKRSLALTDYMKALIAGEKGTELIERYKLITEHYIPTDILPVFDNLFDSAYDIEDIKSASNKLFNILYKTLDAYDSIPLKKDSYLSYLTKDNLQITKRLNDIKPNIKLLNRYVDNETVEALKKQFTNLASINTHYVSKENILFPALEQKWKNHDCLKLMWSFHDDIRKNIKRCIEILSAPNFNLKQFNVFSAKVFFTIHTIIFREEKVLFPIIKESFVQEEIDRMLVDNYEIGFSFVKTESSGLHKADQKQLNYGKNIDLGTGILSLKQLELIFMHLPVDITFVDADDKVRFYSDPEHRIFPRTKSIIGRSVQNCHPPESIDVVNRIVEAFKSCKKDEASFWISMNEKFVLIRYFAVRNENNDYEGTLEVSQEVSDIRELQGEKRLLDWDN